MLSTSYEETLPLIRGVQFLSAGAPVVTGNITSFCVLVGWILLLQFRTDQSADAEGRRRGDEGWCNYSPELGC